MVHHGQAAPILAHRQVVLDAAYSAHPERFVRKPPRPPELLLRSGSIDRLERVLFTTAMDMLNHLLASQVDHSLVRKLKADTEPSLLVCDEAHFPFHAHEPHVRAGHEVQQNGIKAAVEFRRKTGNGPGTPILAIGRFPNRHFQALSLDDSGDPQ